MCTTQGILHKIFVANSVFGKEKEKKTICFVYDVLYDRCKLFVVQHILVYYAFCTKNPSRRFIFKTIGGRIHRSRKPFWFYQVVTIERKNIVSIWYNDISYFVNLAAYSLDPCSAHINIWCPTNICGTITKRMGCGWVWIVTRCLCKYRDPNIIYKRIETPSCTCRLCFICRNTKCYMCFDTSELHLWVFFFIFNSG